jgi:hypothetical protein
MRLAPRTGPIGPHEKAPRHVAFFAPDRAGIATLPVYEDDTAGEARLRVGDSRGSEDRRGARPLFYLRPAEDPDLGVATDPLYEYEDGGSGRRVYSVSPPGTSARHVRVLGRAWRNPARLRLW